MATHISHSCLPYPIKNARFTLEAPFLDADGDPTDPTTPDTEVSQDGGSYADAAEEVTTITGSNGSGYVTLTGAETNNSLVFVALKVASGPKATLATLKPRNLAIVGSGTLSAGSSGGGTLGTLLAYDVTGCFIRTTGGTGGGGTGGANNQARRIITYNTGTGAFTVSPNWETTPSTDTTYDVLLPEGVTLGMLKALNPATPGNTITLTSGGVTLANSASHGGSSAVLTLERMVIASTTTDEPGLKITGNGTAPAVWRIGGATGSGVLDEAGASGNGAGHYNKGKGTGPGTYNQGGPDGDGIANQGHKTGAGMANHGGADGGSGAGNGPGCYDAADYDGPGYQADAGPSGGSSFVLSSTDGYNIQMLAGGSNRHCVIMTPGTNASSIVAQGNGTYPAFYCIGGATAAAAIFAGGSTSGAGVSITTTDGDGVSISAGAVTNAGVSISGGYAAIYAYASTVSSADDYSGVIVLNGDGSAAAGGSMLTFKAESGTNINAFNATFAAGFFEVDSGKDYASAVAGSVVKETADNAGGSSLTVEAIADEVETRTIAGVTTVTNLTNAPTNGDFTATMKASIGTAVAASAVASVTGNVGGNVTGSVGSVVGAVGSVTGTVGGIAGTTTTLDALQTALNSAHGAGSWATATGFSTHSAADVWGVGTRELTAGTNIVLAKGTGITGFNDLSAAQVNAEADAALAEYDAPTDTEMLAAFASLSSHGDSSWATATSVTVSDKTGFSLTSAYDAAKTAAQVGDAMTLTTGERDSIATALLDLASGVETGETVRQFFRLARAALLGKSDSFPTGPVHFRDRADSKDRITATVDSDGNRSIVTTDAT